MIVAVVAVRLMPVVIGGGLKYGKNVSSEDSHKTSTIYWYDDSILELYKLITG